MRSFCSSWSSAWVCNKKEIRGLLLSFCVSILAKTSERDSMKGGVKMFFDSTCNAWRFQANGRRWSNISIATQELHWKTSQLESLFGGFSLQKQKKVLIFLTERKKCEMILVSCKIYFTFLLWFYGTLYSFCFSLLRNSCEQCVWESFLDSVCSRRKSDWTLWSECLEKFFPFIL